MDEDTARIRLEAASKRFADLKDAREQLQQAVLDAAQAGIKQVEIVQRSGWTREYIRRLVAGQVKA